MFLLKPKTAADKASMNLVLAHYQVLREMLDDNTLMLSADPSVKDGHDVLREAEMAFQMNFHQDGQHLCDVCLKQIEKTGEGDSVCGHLTFIDEIPASAIV